MNKDIIVIGTSAGGLDALTKIVRHLPKDFSASIFIVLHMAPESPMILAEILDRAGPLPTINPTDGERIKPGAIYVARPDHHLLLEPGRIRLTRGPKENRFRPAIDPMFRSAAQTYGPRVIGVILTGELDDGTAGLWAVKQLGGTSVVQDPNDALFKGMPLNALRFVKVDYSVSLVDIAPLLITLTSEPIEREGEYHVPENMEIEIKIAKENMAIDAGVFKLGKPSVFSCPECHGVLLELNEGNHSRYRCHTGHAYSTDSLLAALNEKIGETLWSTVRALEEGVLLMKHIAAHLSDSEYRDTAQILINRVKDTQRRAERVRQAAMDQEEDYIEPAEESAD